MPDAASARYDEIEREIERMHSSNQKTKEEGIESLHKISKEIGRSNTIQYMVPFIKTILDTAEEAKRPVLRQIDRIVRELVKEITPLLPVYKEIFLTRSEEIRKHAAETCIATVEYLEQEQKRENEGEMEKIRNFAVLLSESRFIMHRLSSLALIGELVRKRGKEKTIEQAYRSLLRDKSPVVRRKAVLVNDALDAFFDEEQLRNMVEAVLEDAEDSVRSEFASPLHLFLKRKEDPIFLMKIFKASAQDQSWQVRKASSKIIKEVAERVPAVPSTDAADALLLIERLIEDKEKLVRKSATEEIPEVFAKVPKSKQHLLVIVERASRDRSPKVRQSVPEVLSKISETMTKEELETHVLPIVRKLLVDEDRSTKMETVSRIRVLYTKLGSEAVTEALTPVVTDLSSPNWRTRLAVLKSIASFGIQIEQEYFKAHLKDQFFKMFTDPVWSVRKEAANILSEISEKFGDAWILEESLPSLRYLKESTHYMHRISYVTAVSELLKKNHIEEVNTQLEEDLLHLSKDSVAQVRLSVGKAVASSSMKIKNEIIKDLMNDANKEVSKSCM